MRWSLAFNIRRWVEIDPEIVVFPHRIKDLRRYILFPLKGTLILYRLIPDYASKAEIRCSDISAEADILGSHFRFLKDLRVHKELPHLSACYK